MSHIAVRHEQTGQEWACPARYLPHAITKGWRPTDQPEGHGDHGYSSETVPDLKAEIDRRNQDRDESEQLAKSGTKPDLVGALLADDARHPSTS